MAITRQKKEELIKDYLQDLKDSDNLVIVQQLWITVNDSTKIRKSVMDFWWKLNVIRKRLFLRALKDAWYEDVEIKDLNWPVFALYAKWDEYGPLKAINKFLKAYKKDPKSTSSFSFLWWWFDKKWYNWEYVDDLANIPSKEELISKLAYLFNYPLQWFAWVLDQIAKKIGDWTEVKEEVKAEVKEEVKAEVKEEVKGEIKEEVKEVVEPKSEEPKQEDGQTQ